MLCEYILLVIRCIPSTKLFVRRWNPKKRMTPDEALKHEWILSGITQKSNDLRHSQSDAGIEESHSSSGTSASSYLRLHVKCSASKTSDKAKAKIIVDSRLNDSSLVDSNFNDSGTFLPPIL